MTCMIHSIYLMWMKSAFRILFVSLWVWLYKLTCFGHHAHSTKLPQFRTYQIYLFTAQSHVTTHQRDSQAVNVNHPDVVH